MSKPRLTIGIYGAAQHELDIRRFEGVLKYSAERHIDVRDFRLLEMITDLQSVPPPWRGKVDGLVFGARPLPEHSSKMLADWIMSGGVPVVNSTADWIEPRVPVVVADAAPLGNLAAQILLDKGCQSFLYFGFVHSKSSHERARIFAATLREQNHTAIEYQGETLYRGSFEDDRQVLEDREFLNHLKAAAQPLGIWAHNDAYGTAAIKACQALGFEIPAQVKILGTNDTSICRFTSPTLSSIQIPLVKIGYRAAQVLMQMIDGAKVRKVTMLRTAKLVERETTRMTPAVAQGIEAVWKYIQQHACKGVTIEQLLGLMKCSRRTLQSRFIEKYGHSPYDEVHRVRLQRACELLRETQLSVSRIAAIVGFQEIGAFGKFFRKQQGCSPKEYREQHNQVQE